MISSQKKMALGLSISFIGGVALLLALALPNNPFTLKAETPTIDVRFDYTNFPTREIGDTASTVINYGCPYSFNSVQIVPGNATTKSTFTGTCTNGGSAFFWTEVAQGHWTGFTMLALDQCSGSDGTKDYGVVKMGAIPPAAASS